MSSRNQCDRGAGLVSVRSRCASEGIQSLNWRLSIGASLGRTGPWRGHVTSLSDASTTVDDRVRVAVVDEPIEGGDQRHRVLLVAEVRGRSMCRGSAPAGGLASESSMIVGSSGSRAGQRLVPGRCDHRSGRRRSRCAPRRLPGAAVGGEQHLRVRAPHEHPIRRLVVCDLTKSASSVGSGR